VTIPTLIAVPDTVTVQGSNVVKHPRQPWVDPTSISMGESARALPGTHARSPGGALTLHVGPPLLPLLLLVLPLAPLELPPLEPGRAPEVVPPHAIKINAKKLVSERVRTIIEGTYSK
jgi:hypothetical protein